MSSEDQAPPWFTFYCALARIGKPHRTTLIRVSREQPLKNEHPPSDVLELAKNLAGGSTHLMTQEVSVDPNEVGYNMWLLCSGDNPRPVVNGTKNNPTHPITIPGTSFPLSSAGYFAFLGFLFGCDSGDDELDAADHSGPGYSRLLKQTKHWNRLRPSGLGKSFTRLFTPNDWFDCIYPFKTEMLGTGRVITISAENRARILVYPKDELQQIREWAIPGPNKASQAQQPTPPLLVPGNDIEAMPRSISKESEKRALQGRDCCFAYIAIASDADREEERYQSLISTLTEACETSPEARDPWPRVIAAGDGACVIFPAAPGSRPACQLIQRLFAWKRTRDQSADTRYEVCIGLHSAPHSGQDESWLAITGFHTGRAQRIASTAFPGQLIASQAFTNRLKEELRDSPLARTLQVRSERFRIALGCGSPYFDGDELVVDPGPSRDRAGILEEQVIECLVLCAEDDAQLGRLSPPRNALWYLGPGIQGPLTPQATDFQLAPDPELYALYRAEKQLVLQAPPSFGALPFSVLFSTAGGPDFEVREHCLDEQDWKIDSGPVDALFGEPLHDNKLCSLRNFQIDESAHFIELSYASCQYRQSRATLLMPDWAPLGAESLRTQLLQEPLSTDSNRLPRLSSLHVTHHIGVSAMVITADRVPIIQMRGSKGVHSNINSLSASVSGAMDWQDAHSNDEHGVLDNDITHLFPEREKASDGSVISGLHRAIIRECEEELGFKPRELNSIKLLGGAREFKRLGKPEFFFALRTSLKFADVSKIAQTAAWSWEHGGKVRSCAYLGPLPDETEDARRYWANLFMQPDYNEITKAAFYFMFLDGVAGRPETASGWQ